MLIIENNKMLHIIYSHETVCISNLSPFIPLKAWLDYWNYVLFSGFKLKRGTIGLTVNLLKKCLIFAKFLFWGWSYSGSSDLSTSGGSLNYKFLPNHCFHDSLGSITGSEYTFFSFVK
jgi:hypothetical protein